ncbi:MAG TPA: ATP-binding protein [Armatimonadota bacterium]|jgi:hypothetical protein
MTNPAIQLGWHLRTPDNPKVIDIPTPDIAYHTAILAQSGSGKSFLLGRLIEEILLKTKSRVLVLDPNSDFLRVHASSSEPWQTSKSTSWPRLMRDDHQTRSAFISDWKAVMPVTRLGGNGRCRIHWETLLPIDQAALVGIDPVAEAAAYALLASLDDEFFQAYVEDDGPGHFYTPQLVREAVARRRRGAPEHDPLAVDGDAADRLWAALRMVEDWKEVWAQKEGDPSVRARVQSGRWRLAVVDMPSITEERARLVIALQVLDALWERTQVEWKDAVKRSPDTRVPTFVVLDEAHHFAPDRPADALAERVSERVRRIAAEGRKYGLFLILATQRPPKVAPGLLAECENVALLRMQSTVDHHTAADTWGVPIEEIARTRHFGKGDGLLFGRWVPSATAFHSAFRRSMQGGSDLDKDYWARPLISEKL